jgi:phosphatidylglycerol:prolipoprotein diacylglycerol transferase
MVARVLGFVPAVAAYLVLRPDSFAQTLPYQLSTSQLIGVTSALTVAYFYARFWDEARKTPKLALSLGDAAVIRELGGHPPELLAAGPSAAHASDDEEEEGQSGESHA